jgi:hypothetical protein
MRSGSRFVVGTGRGGAYGSFLSFLLMNWFCCGELAYLNCSQAGLRLSESYGNGRTFAHQGIAAPLLYREFLACSTLGKREHIRTWQVDGEKIE